MIIFLSPKKPLFVEKKLFFPKKILLKISERSLLLSDRGMKMQFPEAGKNLDEKISLCEGLFRVQESEKVSKQCTNVSTNTLST